MDKFFPHNREAEWVNLRMRTHLYALIDAGRPARFPGPGRRRRTRGRGAGAPASQSACSGHPSQDGFSRSPVFDRSCMTSHSPCRRRQSPLPHPSGRTEVKHQNYIYTMARPRDSRTSKRWVSLRARPKFRDACAHFQFCIDQEWQIRQIRRGKANCHLNGEVVP